MKSESKKVVEEFLTAVQQGDNAKLAALLNPDITWNQPGDNAISGTKKSSGEVFQMVGKMFEISANSLKLTDFKSLSENDGRVACLLEWAASKPSGAQLAVSNIDVYTVENGQITSADIYSADISGENQFWN